jgi:hypothetical protein
MKKIQEREKEEERIVEKTPSLTEIAKSLVVRLKAGWTLKSDKQRIEEVLDRVGDWTNAELSTNMLGWLYTKTDEQIMEETLEMVGSLEEVAYSNNITRVGEGIMDDMVQLCIMLTTRGADILTAYSKERIEEEQEQGHHQEQGRGHTVKGQGAWVRRVSISIIIMMPCMLVTA